MLRSYALHLVLPTVEVLIFFLHALLGRQHVLQRGAKAAFQAAYQVQAALYGFRPLGVKFVGIPQAA